ncbi:MAG: uroporphyrinogen decarboxylase family protein [bacterium]
MTSAERIFAALEGRAPDRVPAMELAVDEKVMRKLGFVDYFEMVDGLDLDAVIVNQATDPHGVVEWTDRGKKIFRDMWGVVKRMTEEFLPYPLEGPIKSPEDLSHYAPPDPKDNPLLKAIPGVVRRYKGRRAIVLSGRAVFADSWYLRGLENLLMDYITDPDLVRRIGRMVMDYNKELHRLAIRAGVDVIVLGDDYAHKTGPIMSPAHFREFILPGLREVVANIKREGAYCIKHTDGNIWEIIEPIVETGIDGLGPLEPMAGMDLGEVKKRFGDRICVVGNVDVDLLSRGSVDEVRRATRDLIERVSPGGGHILSSGNSISSSVHPENFRAMLETAREFGTY